MWDIAKGVLGKKFITTNTYIENKKDINILTLQLKELENEEQTKPKFCRRKEIIKIRAEINETKKQ